MGKTIRAYNKDPFLWVNYLPPDYVEEYLKRMKWKQVCCGNCPRCKDHKKSQNKKTEKMKDFTFELKELMI